MATANISHPWIFLLYYSNLHELSSVEKLPLKYDDDDDVDDSDNDSNNTWKVIKKYSELKRLLHKKVKIKFVMPKAKLLFPF